MVHWLQINDRRIFAMIHIAIGQCGSTGTAEENQREMERLFLQAAEEDPKLDLMVFPEYCRYTPESRADALRCAIDLDRPDPFVDRMRELARQYRVYLLPGSFPERAEGGKVCNTVLTIDRGGEIVGKYRKIHLFDAAGYRESSYMQAGDRLCLVDADFGKLGVLVCYDLRFPELARSLCLKGADLLVCPAQFPCGQPLPARVDDWDLLIRSTALTNLIYVAGANQFGVVRKDAPFGRSCVADPRGTVIAAASGRSCVVHAFIDLDYQRETRKNLAAWNNRRPDLYAL